MTNPHSPIVDFYPPSFEMDMEGKRAEWEAIVLIPFINQQRLLAAEATIPSGSLTEAERTRNLPGSILIFSHDQEAVNGTHPPSRSVQSLVPVQTSGLGTLSFRQRVTCSTIEFQREDSSSVMPFSKIQLCMGGPPVGSMYLVCHAAHKPAHACSADPASATDCTSTLPSHFASIARCNSRMQRSPPPAPLPPGQPGFTPTLVGHDIFAPLDARHGTCRPVHVTSIVHVIPVLHYGQSLKGASSVFLLSA